MFLVKIFKIPPRWEEARLLLFHCQKMLQEKTCILTATEERWVQDVMYGLEQWYYDDDWRFVCQKRGSAPLDKVREDPLSSRARPTGSAGRVMRRCWETPSGTGSPRGTTAGRDAWTWCPSRSLTSGSSSRLWCRAPGSPRSGLLADCVMLRWMGVMLLTISLSVSMVGSGPRLWFRCCPPTGQWDSTVTESEWSESTSGPGQVNTRL